VKESTSKYPVDPYFKKTRPYAARYAEKYGLWTMMSEDWNLANVSGYKSSEEVYRDCLRKGVTWQELLKYDPDKNKGLVL